MNKKMRQYLDDKIFTVQEMADLCGLSKPAVYAYLMERRRPKRITVLRIIRATDGYFTLSDFGYD